MLEHHFWENFRKWIPHPEVDEVYNIISGKISESGFPILKWTKSMMWKRSDFRRMALRSSCALIISKRRSGRSGPSGWCGTGSSPTPSPTRATARSFGCLRKRRAGRSGPSISARPLTIETSDHLTRFREENYIVPEDTHHFFICGTNLMADILSDEYPTATFLKWGPEIR